MCKSAADPWARIFYWLPVAKICFRRSRGVLLAHGFLVKNRMVHTVPGTPHLESSSWPVFLTGLQDIACLNNYYSAPLVEDLDRLPWRACRAPGKVSAGLPCSCPNIKGGQLNCSLPQNYLDWFIGIVSGSIGGRPGHPSVLWVHPQHSMYEPCVSPPKLARVGLGTAA